MRNRELLADLATLAYETIQQLMADAVGDENARPGVVAVPETFGSVVNVHPHAHCLASRGVWNRQGQWLPLPYVDTLAAEKLFRHKIFRLLKNKELLSDERMELLLSFRNSGFSVDTSPTVWPQDTQGLERLCRYLLRCPVSLSRIHWTPGSKTLFYESKQHANDDPLFSHPKGETLDIFEFIARVLTQIPDPRASSTRREIFWRLFFESPGLPEKTTSHSSIARRRRQLHIPERTRALAKKTRRSQKNLGAAHQKGLSNRPFEM